MKFQESNGLRYLTFDIFPKEVVHGIFTRQGGLSPEPWDSLNLGGTVGDDLDRVRENRYRTFAALGRSRQSIFDVWQVHSSDVVIATSSHAHSNTHPEFKADGIVTEKQDISLFMRFADCTPVLLYDPVKKAIGIVHAGWQGTVKKVSSQTVKVMQAAFGSKPDDILAAIGPAIGPDHYEVGRNVIEQVNYAFEDHAASLLIEHEDKVYFDLWAANKIVLEQDGVKNIEVAGICTACNLTDWYSHRAEKGKTGRFCALIALDTVKAH